MADAQVALGDIYADQSRFQDDHEATKWYRKAADQGHAAAQASLGFLYENGWGVPQNHTEATRWYRQAAEQGDAIGQFNLANQYLEGRGGPQSHADAAAWYRKAADQGYANAQNNLGNAYEKGQGVRQDDAEALHWYALAAKAGNAWGQRNLGRLLRDGRGTAPDAITAHAWLNLASAPDKPHPNAAEERDAVSTSLSKAQLAEAQRLARDWRPGRALGKPKLKWSPSPARTTINALPNEVPVTGYPERPAKRPGVVSCNTRCLNGDCWRTYDNGQRVRFQAKRKFNPFNNQFEWDSGGC